jgi:hypothetical protein
MKCLVAAAEEMELAIKAQVSSVGTCWLSLLTKRCTQEAADIVSEATEEDLVTNSLAESILELWRDEAIQSAYGRRNEFQLNDSAG